MHCECTPVCDWEFDEGTPPTEAVVQALAAVENAPTREIKSLNEVIDTESFNQLFRDHSDGSVAVSFSIEGWNVFVRSDGFVRLCDSSQPAESAPVFERPMIP